MRVTVIYNPTSGDEEQDGGSLRALVEGQGHEVQAASVKDDGWERLFAEPGELVVAAGGDGTIRKVFKELAQSDVDVTVLPLGTANNIARTLGLTERPLDRLVAGWPNGVRRRFDIGKVLASWGNADVVESFGGGLFAEVLVRAEDVDDDETVEAGLRLLEGVLEAVPERDWELDVDGREVSEPLLAVEAMNVRETGPTVPLAPRADPGDGQLEVVRIRPSDREPLLDYIAARLRGESPEAPPLPSVRGSRLTARPPTDCPLRVDDKLWPDEPQAWDAEPVVASMGERAVNVLIPAE